MVDRCRIFVQMDGFVWVLARIVVVMVVVGGVVVDMIVLCFGITHFVQCKLDELLRERATGC